MLPEISRRCVSCGAAVRVGARFCPNCGKPFRAEADPPLTEERAALPATGEWAPTKKEVASPERPSASDEVPPSAPLDVKGKTVAAALSAQEEAEEAGRAGDLRGRVARVREETRARVGRMREEAIVVLEETPDDSGLRFVLVAAALFILSIVLLLLSTTLLR